MRSLCSDPKARRIFDLPFSERTLIYDCTLCFLCNSHCEDVVDHPSRPRSPKVIGNAFTIEPLHDSLFRLSIFNILREYLPDLQRAQDLPDNRQRKIYGPAADMVHQLQ